VPLDEGEHFADILSASLSVELLETLWREIVPPGFTIEGAEEAFSESRGRAYLADVKEAIARQVRATVPALPLSPPPTLPIPHMFDQPTISNLLPPNYSTTNRARTAPSSRNQTRPGTPRDDTETFALPVDVDDPIDVDVDTYEWREDRTRDRLHHPSSTRPGSASGSLDGNHNINARVVVEEGTALDGMASLAERAKGVSYLGQHNRVSLCLSRLGFLGRWAASLITIMFTYQVSPLARHSSMPFVDCRGFSLIIRHQHRPRT
jgi:hypothetical protein